MNFLISSQYSGLYFVGCPRLATTNDLVFDVFFFMMFDCTGFQGTGNRGAAVPRTEEASYGFDAGDIAVVDGDNGVHSVDGRLRK